MPNEAPDVLSRSLSDGVAEEIRVLLARKQKTQRWLADELGMSLQSLNYRLTGKQEIGLNELQRIAASLEVEPIDLMPSAISAGAA